MSAFLNSGHSDHQIISILRGSFRPEADASDSDRVKALQLRAKLRGLDLPQETANYLLTQLQSRMLDLGCRRDRQDASLAGGLRTQWRPFRLSATRLVRRSRAGSVARSGEPAIHLPRRHRDRCWRRGLGTGTVRALQSGTGLRRHSRHLRRSDSPRMRLQSERSGESLYKAAAVSFAATR